MEHDMWRTMRMGIMKQEPKADLQRIENLVRNGMPDVNGCIRGREFWCENKWLRNWPRATANTNAIVKLPKYRKEQRIWIQRRCERGGAENVFMLLYVMLPRQWLLLGWNIALEAGLVPRWRLEQEALVNVTGPFPTELMVARLRQEA
jgi:hypothetical protein